MKHPLPLLVIPAYHEQIMLTKDTLAVTIDRAGNVTVRVPRKQRITKEQNTLLRVTEKLAKGL